MILQGPLVEYDFRVRDLFIDLQDGLKLCRAIHLLQNNSSILKVLYPTPSLIFFCIVQLFQNFDSLSLYGQKIAVPSDTRKKNIVNSGVALQYLRLAGVSLLDEDDTMIVADDIVNGDRELTISLLWNMFVHLQV